MEISPLATPTSKNPIRLLEKESSDIIRACTILPEFHSFVEELVLNSIDANASNIQIILDFRSFSVVVADDGNNSHELENHYYV